MSVKWLYKALQRFFEHDCAMQPPVADMMKIFNILDEINK